MAVSGLLIGLAVSAQAHPGGGTPPPHKGDRDRVTVVHHHHHRGYPAKVGYGRAWHRHVPPYVGPGRYVFRPGVGWVYRPGPRARAYHRHVYRAPVCAVPPRGRGVSRGGIVIENGETRVAIGVTKRKGTPTYGHKQGHRYERRRY
ncbi:MAG: hypothetical protein ACFB20_01960 [Opitutales bacterium]